MTQNISVDISSSCEAKSFSWCIRDMRKNFKDDDSSTNNIPRLHTKKMSETRKKSKLIEQYTISETNIMMGNHNGILRFI